MHGHLGYLGATETVEPSSTETVAGVSVAGSPIGTRSRVTELGTTHMWRFNRQLDKSTVAFVTNSP